MPLLHPRPLNRLLIRRTFISTASRNNSWSQSPAPPRLPKEEQEIFEQLQRQSTGAFSTPQTSAPSTPSTTSPPPSETPDLSSLRTRINQSPDSSPQTQSEASPSEQYKIQAEGQGEELHPHVRRGAQPEFEGETNPKTGEVGGPKNEPLRWGAGGDWSYNGRVTDF